LESVLAFARRRAALVVAIAGLAAAAGVFLVSRVRFDANILRLLPQRSQTVRSFQTFLRDFGSLDHLYVVFEAEDPIDDHTEFVEAYLQRLRSAPEIDSVDARLFEPGKDWSYLSDRALYVLRPDGATEALSRFRSPRLDAEIAHARELLAFPSPQIKTLVQHDPLGLLAMVRDRLGREKGFGFNPTLEGYVSRDGHSRLIVVKPKGPPFDTDFCKTLFRRLTAVEAAARQVVGGSDPDQTTATIQAVGAYRVSLEAEQLIRREGIVNAVGSLALLLVVVFAVFQTPWILLYGSAPLALAAVLTLGLNGLIQGSLSPATSGSAGMLFGLGIDGVVLLYVRYLDERRVGRQPDDAIREMAGTASSVVLAQLTTAATFFALLFVDFPTLQDLGSLVGLGILLCCGATVVLLPALLPKQTGTRSGRAISAPWLGRLVTRAAGPIVWVSAVATILLAAASTRLRLDTTIQRLQAQTRGVSLETEMADRFSLPRDVLLVLAENDDLESLLEADERLGRTLADRAPDVVASSIGFMLPSAREQAHVADLIRNSGLTAAGVQSELKAAAGRAGFRAETFGPFLGRLEPLLDPKERITYGGIVAHGLESVVSRFVVRRDGRYRTVTYLYPPPNADLETLSRTIHDADGRFQLTGLPVINHELAVHFFPQFVRGIAIGTAAVALIVYVVFRTIRDTVLALLPTVIGFIWSAGLLALLRVELDLFSLFAAVTFVGVAVDYGIYVLYRHVFEPPGGMNDVMTRTGAPIMIACATTLIGFGTLVTSSYRPLHVFGIVSLVTLTCCLIASIVFLPALIVQIERW
jgi:uncharacterized protein